ncbi:MAG: peptidylprolyl isomerase [Pseudomonadota bacterium]
MKLPLQDPLVHFLAAGALLFIIGSAIKPADRADNVISVNRAALLDFIQYRSKAFEPDAAAAILDGLSPKARADIVRDYVREEALAREADALGLGANDYVIRQRLVQKVEFLAEAAAAAIAEPTDMELAVFYDANHDRYTSPPSATLTHVFVSTEKKPRATARAEALALLADLKKSKAGFNDATAFGDRFLFHKNYVDRTDDYIHSQLGDEIAAAIFDPLTPLNEWLGPFVSQYGEHLIYVTTRAPSSLPPLSDIRDVVKSDFAEDRRQEAIEKAIGAIVAKYKVEERLDVQ